MRAVEAQTPAGRRSGARALLARHEVLDIRSSDGRVTGVVTDQGEIPADIVVCCAGIWGPKIAAHGRHDPPAHPAGPPARLDRSRSRRSRARPRRRSARSCATRTPTSTTASGSTASASATTATARCRSRPDDILSGRRGRGDAVGAGVHRGRLRGRPGPRRSRCCPRRRRRRSRRASTACSPSPPTTCRCSGESPDVSRASGSPRRSGSPTPPASAGPWPSGWSDGHCSSFDLHECDVNRFEPHQLSPEYVLTRDCQNFVEVYDILHPLQPPEDPRPLRTSPFHPRQRSSAPSSWRRPAGSARSGTRPTPPCWTGRDIPDARTTGRRGTGRRSSPPRRRRPARAGRDVRHDGAEAARGQRPRGRRLPAAAWPPATSTSPSARSPTACCSTHDGGIRSDITVARLGRDRFQVGANGNLDLDWFTRHLPGRRHGRRSATSPPGTCCIGLWGPRARELAPAADRHRTSPTDGLNYFRAQARPTSARSRSPRCACPTSASSAGSSTPPPTMGQKLWDTLWEAGAAATASSPPAAAPSTACGWRRATAPSAPT